MTAGVPRMIPAARSRASSGVPSQFSEERIAAGGADAVSFAAVIADGGIDGSLFDAQRTAARMKSVSSAMCVRA